MPECFLEGLDCCGYFSPFPLEHAKVTERIGVVGPQCKCTAESRFCIFFLCFFKECHAEVILCDMGRWIDPRDLAA